MAILYLLNEQLNNEYPYCKESVNMAQRFNPGHDKVIEDFDYNYDYLYSDTGSEQDSTNWHEIDMISKKTLCGGILSSLSILGIIGNILSIIVFTRPKMNSSSDKILLGKYSFYSHHRIWSGIVSQNFIMHLMDKEIDWHSNSHILM